ncbi:hypothetical protein V8F33_009217 [Rhypophila sp. PSN 637]
MLFIYLLFTGGSFSHPLWSKSEDQRKTFSHRRMIVHVQSICGKWYLARISYMLSLVRLMVSSNFVAIACPPSKSLTCPV